MIGGGPLPIAPGLPVVATLLDLAPWEMPDAFQQLGRRAVRAPAAGPAAARGRGRDCRHAKRWPRSRAGCSMSRRDRLRVVPLAPLDPTFTATPDETDATRRDELRERLGVDERFLIFTGRFRRPTRSWLRCLAPSPSWPRGHARPVSIPPSAWPPQVLLVGASPDDRASIARRGRTTRRRRVAGLRAGAAPRMRWPGWSTRARAAILPVLSEAAGLPIVEAIASGTPVVASAVGALPELVGRGRDSWSSHATRHGWPWRLPRSGPMTWSTTPGRGGGARTGQGQIDGPGPMSPPRPGRSTPRSGLRPGAGPTPADASGAAVDGLDDGRSAAASGSASRPALAAVPSLIVTLDPSGMTWMNVWPAVRVTGLPALS